MLAAGSVGCANLEPPAAQPRSVFSAEDRPYLLPPTEGLAAGISYEDESRLLAGHRALVVGGDLETARREAAMLLEGVRDLAPARVLWAQVRFAEGDYAGVREELEPVFEKQPGYSASTLLLGRALERLDEVVAATKVYSTLAEESVLADVSTRRLEGRAVEILAARVADALSRERMTDAERAVEELRAIAPGAEETLEAVLDVGELSGKKRDALAAARALVARRPGDPELLERLADLELAVGDAGEGLRLFEELAAAYPDETEWAVRADRARFRWRLKLLPAEIGELTARPSLTRGEFAAMIYWLFPNVRHGRGEGAVIASDILDAPWRREIAKVVNLGFLDVEAGVHSFYPDRSIERRAALEALVRLLAAETPAPACLGATLPARLDDETVCSLAGGCGLLGSTGGCLPSAPVGGDEAVELARTGLELLGR